MENLYDYVFWYNPNESTWYAIKTDEYLMFFNGDRSKTSYLKSNKIETLQELICKPALLAKYK